jgi:hypothetical protein
MKTEYYIDAEPYDPSVSVGETIYKIENGKTYGFLWSSQQWEKFGFSLSTCRKITPEEILKLSNIDSGNLGVKKEIDKALFYKEVLDET